MTVTMDRPLGADGRGSPPTAQPASSPRLALKPADAAHGLVDGAWWPRSRDLARELPSLIDTLDRRWARITRITVNPASWPVIPGKVRAAGHVVHVGWFTEQDPHTLLLLSYTTGRWDLLVIPPQCDQATAVRLMAAAADPRCALTAGGLMANEELLRATETDDQAREEDWESEGGTTVVMPSSGSTAVLPGHEERMRER